MGPRIYITVESVSTNSSCTKMGKACQSRCTPQCVILPLEFAGAEELLESWSLQCWNSGLGETDLEENVEEEQQTWMRGRWMEKRQCLFQSSSRTVNERIGMVGRVMDVWASIQDQFRSVLSHRDSESACAKRFAFGRCPTEARRLREIYCWCS